MFSPPIELATNHYLIARYVAGPDRGPRRHRALWHADRERRGRVEVHARRGKPHV